MKRKKKRRVNKKLQRELNILYLQQTAAKDQIQNTRTTNENARGNAQRWISQELLLDNEVIYEQLLLNQEDIFKEGNDVHGKERPLEEQKQKKESKLTFLQRATGRRRYDLAYISEFCITAVANSRSNMKQISFPPNKFQNESDNYQKC